MKKSKLNKAQQSYNRINSKINLTQQKINKLNEQIKNIESQKSIMLNNSILENSKYNKLSEMLDKSINSTQSPLKPSKFNQMLNIENAVESNNVESTNFIPGEIIPKQINIKQQQQQSTKSIPLGSKKFDTNRY